MCPNVIESKGFEQYSEKLVIVMISALYLKSN